MSIDRQNVMKRAHLIAARIGPQWSYRQAIAYGMRTAWEDAKARIEIKVAYGHIGRRPLAPKQIAESRYYTRRCGASWT